MDMAPFCALSILVLAAMPMSEAQGLFPTAIDVRVEPMFEPATPGMGVRDTRVSIEYSTPVPGPILSPTRVDLAAVSDVPWLLAAINPSTIYLAPSRAPCACSVETMHGEAVLAVVASFDAPAFTPAGITVSASAAPNGFFSASGSEARMMAEAGFFALTTAEPERGTLALVPGTRIPLKTTVANHGNAMMLVSFDAESGPDGVSVQAPPPLELGSRQTGERRTSGEVDWWFEADRPFGSGVATLLVHTAYRFDASLKGEDVRVQVRLSDQADEMVEGLETDASEDFSDINPVPDLSVPGSLPALATAALSLAFARRKITRR
ncbi:MAG: hypothetical protein HY556_07650 [Euryarchaeota archaeon]|nr:hypothetical protein [Euryarchaeota archaeon]